MAVPILKWPKAVKCRWLETKNKPLQFKVEVKISTPDYKQQLDDWFKDSAQQLDTQTYRTPKSSLFSFKNFIPKVFAQEPRASGDAMAYLRLLQERNDTTRLQLS